MTVVVTDVSALPGEAAGGAGVRRANDGRRAHALAALAAAELRTGVRRPRAHVVAPVPQDADAVAPVPQGSRGTAGASPEPPVPHAGRLPVQPALADLLPGGALPAGGTIAVQGSTSLLLGLLAAASQEGAWVAFVGAPALGLVAAADAGLALERVAVVPTPGADAPTVVAALLDGVDVVVLGPAVALLDAARRRLAARARERGAVLATTTPWPGAHVSLDARDGSWWGADQGAGWLRRRTLRVRRTGRGAAAQPVELEVEVPVVGGTRRVEPGVVSTGSSGSRGLRVVA